MPRVQEESKSITAEKDFNESMDNHTIQQSDTSFNQQRHTLNVLDTAKEQGLSKIKKKLSLKVVIPEEKRKNSITESNVKKIILI